MNNLFENQTNIIFHKEKNVWIMKMKKLSTKIHPPPPFLKKKCFGRLHPTLEIAAATRASSEKKNYNTITA